MHYSGQKSRFLLVLPRPAFPWQKKKKKQVLITSTEHQEQDLMSPADFQTKHPALYVQKFSDPQKNF